MNKSKSTHDWRRRIEALYEIFSIGQPTKRTHTSLSERSFFLLQFLNEMPFNKRTVEPICLSQVQVPNDIPNELECVANQTLANVIRQLSSLSSHAQDLFDELINDAGHIFLRTEALHGRIERLKLTITQLDSNVEEGWFDISVFLF